MHHRKIKETVDLVHNYFDRKLAQTQAHDYYFRHCSTLDQRTIPLQENRDYTHPQRDQNQIRSCPPLTPWIFFPVTGHLGPLALFLVYW
jgi:hypothetical protein